MDNTGIYMHGRDVDKGIKNKTRMRTHNLLPKSRCLLFPSRSSVCQTKVMEVQIQTKLLAAGLSEGQ